MVLPDVTLERHWLQSHAGAWERFHSLFIVPTHQCGNDLHKYERTQPCQVSTYDK